MVLATAERLQFGLRMMTISVVLSAISFITVAQYKKRGRVPTRLGSARGHYLAYLYGRWICLAVAIVGLVIAIANL